MDKAGFVGRLITYLEEYKRMKEAEDDKKWDRQHEWDTCEAWRSDGWRLKGEKGGIL